MEIKLFLICDDIRNELGNKMSILGIYDESIEFSIIPEVQNQWPKGMKLACFAKFSVDENDRNIKSFKFMSIQNNEKNIIAQGILQIEKVLELKRFNIVVVIDKFIFKNPGEIYFKYEFFDDKDQLLITKQPDYKLKISEKIISY
jgi:hypothetical protein